MTTADGWTIARLMCGAPVNGELSRVSSRYKGICDHLAALPLEGRLGAWNGFLAGLNDPEAIANAVLNANPVEPPPEALAGETFATLADIARIVNNQPWLWRGWLARGVLNVLASEPGTGKTRFGMDLARRLYFGLPWPDSQANDLPPGTRTLWVQGDRNFAEMLQVARDFGLPDTAVALGSAPDDPTGALDLDDPATLDDLDARIQAAAPALVILDTVGMVTARNLCRPEEARAFFAPLMELAGKTGVAFLGQTHLSKDKEALGRRIVEKARVVVKMTQPDPEGQQDRRRLWVDKTAVVKPPPLGITMGDAGNEYDFDPPAEPTPSKGGRPPKKLEKAIAFLTEKLGAGDRQWCELIDEWEAAGEAKGTIFNASEAMQKDGRLTIDESVKPKVCHLVKNPENGQEPGF